MDYSKLTLGELISFNNAIIKRNAMSILKQLQNNAQALQEAQTAKERQEIAKEIAKTEAKEKPLMCFFCHVKPATVKDYREIDGMTGSYPVCKKCFNLSTEEVMRINDQWFNDNIPF